MRTTAELLGTRGWAGPGSIHRLPGPRRVNTGPPCRGAVKTQQVRSVEPRSGVGAPGWRREPGTETREGPVQEDRGENGPTLARRRGVSPAAGEPSR